MIESFVSYEMLSNCAVTSDKYFNETRLAFYCAILPTSKNRILPNGVISKIAKIFKELVRQGSCIKHHAKYSLETRATCLWCFKQKEVNWQKNLSPKNGFVQD